MLAKRSTHLIQCVMIVLIMGIASRVFHTGFPILDEYLGDALYAVLFYLLLSLFWKKGTPLAKASLTMFLMIVIETFQLTLIPLRFRLSSSMFLKLLSIALGTKFACLDLVSYAVGILAIFLLDYFYVRRFRSQAQEAERTRAAGNVLEDAGSTWHEFPARSHAFKNVSNRVREDEI